MFAQKSLLSIKEIQRRLEIIFPDSISDRNYLIREMAAKTVFIMLYIDAIEGRDIWLAPKQVYRMSDDVAKCQDHKDREKYKNDSMKRGYRPKIKSWYEDNTREPIRDETLKDGLVQKGAVIVNHSIATTSGKGRYALKSSFAELFTVDKSDFLKKAKIWSDNNLNPSELAKVHIMQNRQLKKSSVNVILPNGESRVLSAGPSSIITKAVVEEFASRHLSDAAVLWISESSNKVVLEDDYLMKKIGLNIDQQKILPDIILADLGRPSILIIFVEVVATDGPITESRKEELYKLTDSAGFPKENIVFISAYEQRNSQAFKKRFAAVAVDSLIWFTSEPDLLVWLGKDKEIPFDLN